jgi:hypothetical protein
VYVYKKMLHVISLFESKRKTKVVPVRNKRDPLCLVPKQTQEQLGVYQNAGSQYQQVTFEVSSLLL